MCNDQLIAEVDLVAERGVRKRFVMEADYVHSEVILVFRVKIKGQDIRNPGNGGHHGAT